MKRSEMLQIINKRTNDPELSDIILRDMELFGMLPPEKKLGMREAEVLHRFNISDQVHCYHSWENEE